MSDKEDIFESEEESGEDFSASEDEWKPGKGEISDEDSMEESDNSEEEGDADEDSDDNKKRKPTGSKKTKSTGRGRAMKIGTAPKLGLASKRRPTSSLRSRMQSKYNPPPKLKATISDKVSEILSSSQFVQRQKMPSTSKASQIFSTSDSGSGGEDGFIDPNQTDNNQRFFDSNQPKQPTTRTETHPPNFDCNAGVCLSESSDSEDDDSFVELPNKQPLAHIEPAKEDPASTQTFNDLSHIQEFNRNLETAKKTLGALKEQEATTTKADEIDIGKLLSMGEGIVGESSSAPRTQKRKKRIAQDSDDSEWENVSENNDDERNDSEIKDIQITVGTNDIGRHMSREQKKAIDIEACLKRRLNRDIKERQIYLHKASVLCWIAHGNYINRILNDLTLMEISLKLLPSKNAYPKGDTDINYYKMFTDWFHQLFQLKSDKLYSGLKGLTKKRLSLALQLQTKNIISKSDFVQLFVIMLRSIGIQCRLVINFAAPPLRPPQKELFVVSSKPQEADTQQDDGDGDGDNKSKKKASSSKSKNHTATKDSASSKLKTNDKIKKSAEKDKQSNKEHSKTSHQHARKPKDSSKSKLSAKDDESPERETSTSHASSSKKTMKVNLARLSKKTIRRMINEPLPNSPKHREHSQSSSDKNNSSTKHNHSDRHSTKRLDGSTLSSNGESRDKAEKSSMKSKTVKKKAEEPLNNVTPPKIAKKSNLTSKHFENEKPSSNSPKPTPRKTRLRSRTIEQSKMEVKPSTSAAFAQKKNCAENNGSETNKRPRLRLKIPQMDGGHDIGKRKKRTKLVKVSESSEQTSDCSDFEPVSPKRNRAKVNLDRSRSRSSSRSKSKNAADRKKSVDRRVFSTDDEAEAEENTNRMDFWVEAYAEKEKKWVAIDPVKRKVDCVDFVRKHCSKPVIYVFAWNNDQTIRDVTPRYCLNFHTTTRKQRAEQLWIDVALDELLEDRNPRTIIEDIEFSKLHMDTPMPTAIGEFKNHPLYALERHLLKFEAIYPYNSLTLGYIRKEPIFARECVHTLYSREIWVKQARTVKLGEQPYKIVKSRPRWNRALNQMEECKPLEIFGFWQTEPYKPPTAENGVVPRNAYGNVELFKPEMLPFGTRHLQLPNLNRVCKKLGVDCAQAVIGFDFHGGSSHPTFDGFVVCEEFADEVIKQWEIDVEEQIRKDQEKREARVYGNWKKLIKGLFIRERLKRKFNFGQKEDGVKKPNTKKKEKP